MNKNRKHPFSLDDVRFPMALLERFWTAVEKPDAYDESCWGWSGSRNAKTRYGHLDFASKSSGRRVRISAHRYSYAIHHDGQLPEDLFVCHRCDNPPCTNPAHLFLGTNTDNMRDSIYKGRHNSFGLGRLSGQQVQLIRQLAAHGLRHWEIADRFGVTRTNVGKILTGKSWAHLPVVRISETA